MTHLEVTDLGGVRYDKRERLHSWSRVRLAVEAGGTNSFSTNRHHDSKLYHWLRYFRGHEIDCEKNILNVHEAIVFIHETI